MSKSKKPDINKILLRAHKAGVKKAIDASARAKTSLVVYEGGKVRSVKPPYTYERVAVTSPKSKVVRKSPAKVKK